MNQKVEEIYAKMFAPNPIPIEVIELYDKVNFLATRRLGLPGLKMSDLAVIAGVAITKKSRPDETAEYDSEGHELVDTREDSNIPNPVEKVEMLVSDDEGEFNVDALSDVEPAPDPKAPTGPMDAPTNPEYKKKRNNLEVLLNTMTKNELLNHATNVCKIPINTIVGRQRGRAAKSEIDKVSKQQIIKLILEN